MSCGDWRVVSGRHVRVIWRGMGKYCARIKGAREKKGKRSMGLGGDSIERIFFGWEDVSTAYDQEPRRNITPQHIVSWLYLTFICSDDLDAVLAEPREVR